MNHTDDTITYTKPKTMKKYRVKTRQLKSFNHGDLVEKRTNRYWLVTDNKNHCLSLPAAMVENTNWFYPVEEEVKEGQYRRWDDEVYRVMNPRGNDWLCLNIRTGFQKTPNTYWLEDNSELLDDDAIESALVAEAKRRGFECDLDNIVKFKPIKVSNIKVRWEKKEAEIRDSMSQQATIGKTWIYDPDTDTLINSGWVGVHAVYHKGEFAELVEDEPIQINGCKVNLPKFNDDHTVQVGYAEIPIGTFNNFSKYGKKYDIKFMRKGEDITDAIHEVVNRI